MICVITPLYCWRLSFAFDYSRSVWCGILHCIHARVHVVLPVANIKLSADIMLKGEQY